MRYETLSTQPLTLWVKPDRWSCRRHYPSVMLPAEADKCWYKGCPSTRPLRAGEAPRKPKPVRPKPEVIVVVAPPPPEPEYLVVHAPVPTNGTPVSHMEEIFVAVEPVPEIVSADGPTEAEKHRGATHAVQCPTCGKTLWRRPREVRESPKGLFFCGPACRRVGK